MNDVHESAETPMPNASRATPERGARVLGWISGLGLLVVPVVVAGLGWIAYGSVRIDGFRRGALPGAANAVVVLGGIYAAGLLSR